MGTNGWGERGATAASVPVVTLSTPRLRSAFLNGGGRLTIANMEGPALDLAVTGSGTIIPTGLDARQLDARVIGTGALQLACVAAQIGRAAVRASVCHYG